MAKQKILIVDDDKDANDIVRDCLDAAGYATIQAFTAEEAIEKADAARLDLVVLDINLPDGSGEMVYAALQGMTSTKSLPVVIISGETPARVRKMQSVKDIPAADIFVKPLDISAFLERVHFYLAEKKKRALRRILIVDDDSFTNEIIKENLEAAGYSTLSAFGGYDALALAKEKRPDLILLDLNLPAGSGSLAYTVLQSLDGLSGIPVIIISGEDPEVIRRMQTGKTISCEDIFLKPLDFRRLFMRIARRLSEK
ncbi:MAG: hypothetical protein COS41_05820 [Elusimicrobia bacterium CG03_land_8_20_14_0_80_50_18]|nr:MAG: hypothetical protein COS41_05820 [Elusimicrobia bacterium CG03_land_8_20_14_0_80_50_18]PIX15193.1 MAG: hypothetical protein COZ72_04085 [Elusimicrobia bacterium CG_4_8_14_3_um_filter_50_9]